MKNSRTPACTHAHTYTYINTCTRTYTHTHTNTHTHTHRARATVAWQPGHGNSSRVCLRVAQRTTGGPGASPSCEDTPSRPHATTTPYDPSPPRHATTTHVTTQVKTPRSPIALYSKSLNCYLGIFLIFFLTRLRYRPFPLARSHLTSYGH